MPTTKAELHTGDSLQVLKTMETESVNCCITSPPYYGLRDYEQEGQIGLEKTPQEYIARLVAVFEEVRRVLRKDGTCWLNLGDSYAGGKGQSGSNGADHQETRNQNGASLNRGHQTLGGKKQTKPTDDRAMLKAAGIKPKDLMMMPHRVAIALQEAGWYVRSDIVWSKPNPMPESVTDRPTKAHEYIFLLAKSEKYYYDHEAIKEPSVTGSWDKMPPIGGIKQTMGNDNPTYSGNRPMHNGKRNKRSVWTVSTKPYKEAHFATFPPDLIRPCVLAGCPEEGIILDPFAGAGTTGLVALSENRNFIGIELNPTM